MKRVLILAHREELILQAVGHAKNAGHSAGVEMGVNRAKREEVVCSTVQTLNSISKCRWCSGLGCELCNGKGKAYRMTKFDPWEFGLVITDEAHHGTATTYRRVYEHFKQNKECRFLNVTATPKRTDEVGLHNICDSVAYKMDLHSAIDQGWLCPIRQQFIHVDSLSLVGVKTNNKGDLADGDLQRAFLGETTEEEERLLHEVAGPTVKEAAGRPTLVFASGVAHAEKLTAAFNAYDGVNAEYVVGTTDRDERKRIISRYKSGETQILVGCGVFTEGFDAPGTVVVANARPTKSEGLYCQMIGRGTRTLPGIVDGPEAAEERKLAIANSGKPHCIVLDFVGDSGRHKLVSVLDVLAGEDCEPEDLSTAVQEAQELGEQVDMEELLEKVKEARERKELEAEERRKRIQTRTRAGNLEYSSEDVDLFDGRSFNAFEDYEPVRGMPTQKMVHCLVGLGVKPETATNYSFNQAKAVIGKLKSKSGKDYIVPFGRYRGKPLHQLPSGYVNWMQSNINRPDVIENIQLMKAGQ